MYTCTKIKGLKPSYIIFDILIKPGSYLVKSVLVVRDLCSDNQTLYSLQSICDLLSSGNLSYTFNTV